LAKGIIIDGRAILGFSVVDETNKVDSVAEKSAAEKAGLKEGDVIIQIGGVEIEDKEDIASAKNGLRPFMKTEIVVERDGEEKTLELIVSGR
jgi:serine protease Do